MTIAAGIFYRVVRNVFIVGIIVLTCGRCLKGAPRRRGAPRRKTSRTASIFYLVVGNIIIVGVIILTSKRCFRGGLARNNINDFLSSIQY